MSKSYKFSSDKGIRPSVKVGEFTGTVLGEEVLREVEVWARLLPTLCSGVEKPHSVIYEIQRLERESLKKGEDYGELIDNIKKCCPPGTTVKDSLEFKNLRMGIISRIEEITGIGEYYYGG